MDFEKVTSALLHISTVSACLLSFARRSQVALTRRLALLGHPHPGLLEALGAEFGQLHPAVRASGSRRVTQAGSGGGGVKKKSGCRLFVSASPLHY